jgi:carboxyl-terminal processing protease
MRRRRQWVWQLPNHILGKAALCICHASLQKQKRLHVGNFANTRAGCQSSAQNVALSPSRAKQRLPRNPQLHSNALVTPTHRLQLGNRPTNVLGWAVALALFLTGAKAQTAPPHARPHIASHHEAEETALRKVLADRLWVDFSEWLVTHHVTPLDTANVLSACQDGITKKLPLDAQPSHTDLVLACIESVVAALGEPSSFESATQFAARREDATGGYAAVGLELGAKPVGSAQPVVSPIAGGPGERAGLRAKDRIIQIDAVDVRPLPQRQTLLLMRGPAGSTVDITVEREGEARPLRISVQRELIRVRTAQLKRLPEGLLYLRVSTLGSATGSELEALLQRERAAASQGPVGLILDLRLNSGGLLDTVADLASFWADTSTLVVSYKRYNHSEELRTWIKEYGRYAAPAALRQWLRAVPLVVLVDDKTAAGAEALAQFLRETQAATLLGQTTYGAPQIRTLRSIGNTAAAAVHTANMASPAGLVWSKGLRPDQVLARPAQRYDWGDENDPWLQQAARLLATKR